MNLDFEACTFWAQTTRRVVCIIFTSLTLINYSNFLTITALTQFRHCLSSFEMPEALQMTFTRSCNRLETFMSNQNYHDIKYDTIVSLFSNELFVTSPFWNIQWHVIIIIF